MKARRRTSRLSFWNWVFLALAFIFLWLLSIFNQRGLSVAGWVAIVLTGTALLALVIGPRRFWRGTAFAVGGLFRVVRPRRRGPRPVNADLLSILTLSSYGFELFCRDLLEHEGYKATATKQTGDQGVDVELRAKDGRIGIAQCKQVLNTRIGRPVLQQLYGEMVSRRATFGFLITTGTFTAEAEEWARTKTITLVDRDSLLRMVDRHARES